MKGTIDPKNRALLKVRVARSLGSPFKEIEFWIDTAFDGHLVCSSKLIKELGLDSLAQTEAILADGSRVVLESYYCMVDWFGAPRAVQVIENEGSYPLLGIGLLEERELLISYRQKQLNVD